MGVTITQEPAIKKGTHYVSIGPQAFSSTTSPDVDDRTNAVARLTLNATTNVMATIQIPHGAVVTGAIVYGSSDENWTLYRVNHAAGITAMATAANGSEDTSISFATVDNENYSYVFVIPSIDNAEYVQGARITYTL